jgi:hypothetical protein
MNSLDTLLKKTTLPWQWTYDVDAADPERMWCIDDGKGIPLADNFLQDDAVLAVLAVNLLKPFLELYEVTNEFITWYHGYAPQDGSLVKVINKVNEIEKILG